jgi:hypothetical protein
MSLSKHLCVCVVEGRGWGEFVSSQSTPPATSHSMTPLSIKTEFSHLFLGLHSNLFPSGIPSKVLCEYSSHLCVLLTLNILSFLL